MIDVSSRRPPDSFAAARAAHGELESEGEPRSWPPARLAAARAAHGELESEDVPRSWPSARPTASKTERRRGSHRGVRVLAVW